MTKDLIFKGYLLTEKSRREVRPVESLNKWIELKFIPGFTSRMTRKNNKQAQYENFFPSTDIKIDYKLALCAELFK
jgi:hypothetical protein